MSRNYTTRYLSDGEYQTINVNGNYNSIYIRNVTAKSGEAEGTVKIQVKNPKSKWVTIAGGDVSISSSLEKAPKASYGVFGDFRIKCEGNPEPLKFDLYLTVDNEQAIDSATQGLTTTVTDEPEEAAEYTNTEVTVESGETSAATLLNYTDRSSIAVYPEGKAKCQYTLCTEETINNNEAVWIDWPLGIVTKPSVDTIMGVVIAVRLVSSSGAARMQIRSR